MKKLQTLKTAIDLMLRCQDSTYERNGSQLVFQNLKRRPKQILTVLGATRYVFERGQIDVHVSVNDHLS